LSPGQRVLEWFLFEERDPRVEEQGISFKTIYYLMSSDLDCNYFIPQRHKPLVPVIGIGFYAITISENIRLTVNL